MTTRNTEHSATHNGVLNIQIASKSVIIAICCLLGTSLSSYAGEPDPTTSYELDVKAKRIPLGKGQIYSGLTWQQARVGVPKIRLLNKKEEEIEYIGSRAHLIDTELWQESPSRIIYHEGTYHTWIMTLHDGDTDNWPEHYNFRGENFHLTSDDGYRWTVGDQMPDGEPGSFDQDWREGLQVVKHDGKFWMFYAGVAPDPTREQYPMRRGGGDYIGLLVAESPYGPWEHAVEEPIISRSDGPQAWDFDMCNNPYPTYFNGKWFVYYKSRNLRVSDSVNTLQGVAVAEKITGPYVKYENNPICEGHGSFVWNFRGGISMLPFANGGGRIHWSPDGLRWHNVDDPLSRGVVTPKYSAFYLPNDPLSGDPITTKEPHVFWGLDTRTVFRGPPKDFDLFRSTVEFNQVK